jgi:hypothetical protein
MVDLTSMDPVSMMAMQIKAKASAAAATGKTATKSSTTTTTKKLSAVEVADKVIAKYGMKDGDRPTELRSARSDYLRSIDAKTLKEAAKVHGLDVKFGLKPMGQKWLDANPEIKAQMDKITQTMADLKASSTLTASITGTLGDVAD